jgi:hypothetical protein
MIVHHFGNETSISMLNNHQSRQKDYFKETLSQEAAMIFKDVVTDLKIP